MNSLLPVQDLKGTLERLYFDMEEDGLYSVVMGDLNDQGELLSFKPTGNNDAKKVLATVADVIEFFIQQSQTPLYL